MKGNLKKVLSMALAMITVLTTAVQPLAVSAAQTDAGSEKPPVFMDVKDQLDSDEVVAASDYSLYVGTSFDVNTDFSGIEIPKGEKVKVTFEEATNEQGEDFSTDHADIYEAVYYVEPVTTDHPTYQISRKLIVVEPGTAVIGAESHCTDEGGQSSGDMEDAEEDSESDTGVPENSVTLSENELDAALEKVEEQETYDSETGLSVSDVLVQGEEQGIEMFSMEAGETVTFQVKSRAARATSVSVTRGQYYYYSDYGLGSFVTAPYYVKFGNISATAYCVQPSKPGPGDGVYTITKLEDGKTLAKVCYYGTLASGEEGFFREKHPDFSAGKCFIITHLAAAYANGSSDAFTGTNSTGKALAMELYNYCVSQPDIPNVAMAFTEDRVTAYVDGEGQRTKSVTFKADVLQTITMNLPDGVKLHNETTGQTSKAGADVEICGGTKFYLSAPLTQAVDVEKTYSQKMKGSITKDYSAYKIMTGTKTQDLALVFGEGVDDEKYVTFSATWVDLATVSIVKKDTVSGEKLAGAVYGIYSDEGCTNLMHKLPVTDKNGTSTLTFPKTQETVFLKEITAPNGYVVDAIAKNVKLVSFQDVKNEVQDKEQLAQLTIYKMGEVLTGADVTEDGVKFHYVEQKLKGAKYDVYAAEDIISPTGNLIHKKGTKIAENLTTDQSGSVTLPALHMGNYTVKEVQAPANYHNAGESKTVVLEHAGQHIETVFSDMTFKNERQKAVVSVSKEDVNTKNPLSGGIYGLYADCDIKSVDGRVLVSKGTLIEKVTTGNNGKAAFTADIPINADYSIKEEQAPDLYYRDKETVYRFSFDYTNDQEKQIKFSHTFANDHVNAEIQLIKVDAETGKAQGDGTLEGAVYGLYARNDIVHPDGKTGVIYKAGTQITELITDKNGKASVQDLYLGEYYVKELRPSEGYLLDEKEYDLNCSYEGDLVTTVKKEITSNEVVMKQPFQIIKAANNEKTDADLLKGAGFTAYLESRLEKKADGSYDFASAQPVVIGANGATEIFTDEKGHAVSIALPYGTYIVRETTIPHNYTPVDDFEVKITENHPTEPQIWRVLLDDEFEAKLKVVKKDDETKKAVLLAGTEFKIYDLEKQKYVEQVTTYPTTVTHKSYFTDKEGYLILPNALNIGKYRIEEVTAPNGYTLNKNFVEIKVDSNTAYHMDSLSGDVIIEAEYENHPVKGELTIVKQGEKLSSYDGEFHYQETELAGAEFEVYAAEDIYTADHQKDAEDNRTLEYSKDELVTTVTTDANGKAVIRDLPLGKYVVREEKAPEGFVLNTDSFVAEFTYVDQNTPVVKQEIMVEDERQTVQLAVVKKDAENGATVSGAVFGLYNAKDILSGDKIIVKSGTLLQKMTTDETGKAMFTLDFPLGEYYVKELKAPNGYVSSDEVLKYDASYQGQDVKVVEINADKKNKPTVVEITKQDLTSGEELEGATLTVLDKDGNVIDTWTSVKDEPHVLKRLTVGETYTLREEFAPYGYLKATDVEFTVLDTAEVQPVVMKDEVPKGLLIINKKGEFLDKVTLLDNAKGTVEHLFEYITGNLTEVTFEVYAAEDIKAADGVSGDYYKADELVGTITTDEKGIAQLGELPIGKYYVKETETAHGYVLDGEIRYVDLSYRDQETPVVTYDEDWQNIRQKVTVSVLKTEKDSDRVLEGGSFGLFTREDILSASGEVLMEADTLIELKGTDENGQILFMADLPVDGTYYVKEIYAPDGFVTTEEEQEFMFEYAGNDVAEAKFDFVFENEPTTVEFTKSDLTTGEELPGAHLEVTDKDGNVVDEWISGEEPHIIKELVVDQEYTLTETLPADGYVTAESITFKVTNTAEIQKVEMKDDVTKVEISKTDIAGNELPGAKLTILNEEGEVVESWTSTDEPHYIEMLPIGKYVLREEAAPEGYLVAEDVEFEVIDTAEIQKVHMVDDAEPAEDIPNQPSGDTPKTGDDRNIGLWFALLILGICGTAASFYGIHRRKR